MSWLRIIRTGLVIGREEFRIFWPSWRVWLVTQGLRMTTSAAMLILLGRLLGSEELVHFLAIGQVAIIGPQMSGWAIQSFTWDRAFIQTYVHLVSSPSSMVPIMIGRTTIWLMNGIFTAALMTAVVLPAFGVPISVRAAAVTLAMCALMCVSSYGFWFCIGSLINFVPHIRNIVHNLLVVLLSGICGVAVPVTMWPEWVQWIAAGLPVTHGLTAIRAFLAGGDAGTVIGGLALELMVGAGWFAVGLVTLDLTTSHARRHGTLELG